MVADEVRTLANRTQGSTEQIRKLINKLQAGANNAVIVAPSSIDNSAQVEEVTEPLEVIRHEIFSTKSLEAAEHGLEKVTPRLDNVISIFNGTGK